VAARRGFGGFVFANLIFNGAGLVRGLLAEPLELEEGAEGARVGTLEAGFGAMQDRQIGRVGEGSEGFGEGLDGSEGFIVVVGGEVVFVLDGFGEELVFDEGEAGETPPGGVTIR
jgi:hypothetical protein